MRSINKILLVVGVFCLTFLSVTLSAYAAGSDGTPPYAVTKEGIYLPEGETFKAHGHVNIRWENQDGTGKTQAGIHFDPNNNKPGGYWIGKNFIPWSAFPVPAGKCVSWVQLSQYNQHFGEGKDKPRVCLDETPGVPEEPEEPETPEAPEGPETPEKPEEPETPEAPEGPETPEKPETPEDPEVTDEEDGDDPEDPDTRGGDSSKHVTKSVDCQLLLTKVTVISKDGKSETIKEQRWITKKQALKIDPGWEDRCGKDEIIIVENG